MTAEQFFMLSGAELRAWRIIYRRYRFNRSELVALQSLAAFLQLTGRRCVSIDVLIRWLSVGGELKQKVRGHVWGCIKKGAIHRLRYLHAGNIGNSLALSGFGAKILSDYWAELEKVERARVSRANGGGYDPLQSLVVNPDNPPKKYTVMERGRME